MLDSLVVKPSSLQCFETVGWVTTRASQLSPAAAATMTGGCWQFFSVSLVDWYEILLNSLCEHNFL